MRRANQRSSIGELCDFVNGNGFRPPDWKQSGLPIIRIQNLNGSTSFNYFDGEPKQKWIVEPGDLLFAWAGVKGVSFGPTIWPGPRGVLNQHIFRVVPKKGVDKYWLYLALQVATVRIEANAHGFKSSLVHVQKDDITEQAIDLPPLPEQRKIAEILRTWDEAIEKLDALRAAKLRRHRALTHSLVFGTRQLDRFRTTDEVATHRWFTLPATWSIKPIGKLAREISERNGDAEQHEVLSCSKYDGFVRSLEYFKKQVFSADLSGYKKIWRGDFGFPSNHVEEGSIGLQNLMEVGVVSPIYTVFRFAPEKVDADYAFAVLKTGLYRHIFEVSTSASVDRRGSLRWTEFSKLPFPVPSLAEQKAIAEVLRTAKVDLDALSAEIEALSRQKRGLMQKLLTGEWHVKVEAH
ncbi:type I restriction enzyme S subunit [Pseudochelatococcus lubricantis]|uniref:Type I restriction enzyme S subunit n=1 Tax=Pseudochelatococcus lubricantis TaxID=1538102 RepID=A0ABX0V485_9HYPH|nr:restriction endonuclease subunit S [Pseudochelatococcus lubricantis]NIJ59195.1 type I restriction enzyme S subunit [Pseudochelatococcus lubricantis]